MFDLTFFNYAILIASMIQIMIFAYICLGFTKGDNVPDSVREAQQSDKKAQ